MDVIKLSNPTEKEYNIIKNIFGELLNEYHFLLRNNIHDQKTISFMSDMKICRFNPISVNEVDSYINPCCNIIDVDFIDFMIIANKQFRVFSEEEEKAWRKDLSNKTALELTKII